MTVTVFIADDQAMVRQGFRALLDVEPDLKVVGDAADGKAAVAGVVDTRPDVVLLDIRMPVMNGLEAAGPRRSCWPTRRAWFGRLDHAQGRTSLD